MFVLCSPFPFSEEKVKKKGRLIKLSTIVMVFHSIFFVVFMIAVSLIATAILPTQQLLGMQFYFTILNVFLWSHGRFFCRNFYQFIFIVFVIRIYALIITFLFLKELHFFLKTWIISELTTLNAIGNIKSVILRLFLL